MAVTIDSLSPSEEKSSLGICNLQRFWEKIDLKKRGIIANDAYVEDWDIDVAMLAALGIGIVQTLSYLYSSDPNFEIFENWVLSANNNQLSSEKIDHFNRFVLNKSTVIQARLEDNVLSKADLAFFETNGYVVIKNAVSRIDCKATVEAICEYLEIDLNDAITWYMQHEAKQGIMVQLFQHSTIQKNRENAKIRKAYAQLWNRNDIFVNIDKVGFNPPETVSWKFSASPLHWDVSLKTPIPFGLQGMLYLTDTAANQGAFTVVPGFHNKIEDWLATLPKNTNPRQVDLYQFNPTPIAAEAGDFVIWHHALPHCASPNNAQKPRFVQYMTYAPLNIDVQTEWI